MKTKQCPSQQELSDYDLGKLAARRRDAISEHLDECQACSSVLAALDEQVDDLIGRLREKLPPEIVQEDSELHRLVEAAAALQNTDVAGVGDTHPNDASTRKPPLERIIAQVLRPAETTDEIGRLGGYRVLTVLGVGGMGVVFQAEDPALGRKVALKAMLPHVASSETSRDRFLREARAASIQHDNIVTIHQVGRDGEVPFIAMQLLEGESLSHRLSREPRLPIEDALQIARETAQGLAAAHAKGLTHRDIKPDNIWLEAGTGRVKILDFGLARAADDHADLTQTGAVVGTPSYLAPEQAMGKPVDARADLFSLGVVLYQMLTGRKPFQRGSILATLLAIDRETPPAPLTLRPDVPAGLSELVMRLLEKDPTRRFASAPDLLAALRLMETNPPFPSTTHPAERKALPPRAMYIAMLTASALVLLAAAYYRIQTDQGTLVVTIEDPAVQTIVEKDGLVIRDKHSDRTWTIKAAEAKPLPSGEYHVQGKENLQLVVTDDSGVELTTDTFNLKRQGEVRVRVTLERNASVTAKELAPSAISTPDRRDSKKAPEPPPGWQVYRSETGGYSVWFPSTPAESQTGIATKRGEREMNQVKLVDATSGLTFMVTNVDFIDRVFPDAEKALDSSLDGAMQKYKAELLNETRITLGIHPGRELRFGIPNAKGVVLRLRIYLVGQRNYQLLVVGPELAVEGSAAEAFLQSFRLNREI